MANGNGGYGGGYGFRQGGFGGNDQAFNNAFGTRMGVAQPYDQNNAGPSLGGNTGFVPRPPTPYTGDPNNMGNGSTPSAPGGFDLGYNPGEQMYRGYNGNDAYARPTPGAGFNPTANPMQGRGFPFAPPPELPPWVTPGAPEAPGQMGVKGQATTNGMFNPYAGFLGRR